MVDRILFSFLLPSIILLYFSILNKMNQWDEVANMRTVLLHLQFVCAGLEEKIDEQEEQLHRGRQDRILQLRDISQQNQHLQQSNFHHLLIVKIEELLGVYEEVDESIW